MKARPSPRAVPSVVVHIPHASLEVPADVFVLSPHELSAELLRMTDRYTDELFSLSTDPATTVVYPVSRLVVDPERFLDDDQERMAAKGMGAIYTRSADGRPLRGVPSVSEREHLLARFYVPHHAALTAAVGAAHTAHGSCLVIDGHSFPSRPLPYEDDQDPLRPDICIGTDPAHTPAKLCAAAVRAFEEAGWSVAIDRPFSGALVPMRFYRTDLRVRALMVEVNRRVYMDESSGERRECFDDVARRLRRALAQVIEFASRV